MARLLQAASATHPATTASLRTVAWVRGQSGGVGKEPNPRKKFNLSIIQYVRKTVNAKTTSNRYLIFNTEFPLLYANNLYY